MKTNLKELAEATENKNIAIREQRMEATKAHYVELERIKAEIAAVEAPFDAQIEANDDALHQARVDAHNSDAEEMKLTVSTLPSQDVFNSTLIRADQVYGNGFKSIYTYSEGVKPIRAPKVDGFTILAAYVRNEKLYAAWSVKTGKLVGVMYVEAARHPGDSTNAFAKVNGVEVTFPEGSNYGVGKPVETFVAALKNSST
jgi:hypothetical protein